MRDFAEFFAQLRIEDAGDDQHTHDDGAAGPEHMHDEGAAGPEHMQDDGAAGPEHMHDEGAAGPEHMQDEGAAGPEHQHDEGAAGPEHQHDEGESVSGPTSAVDPHEYKVALESRLAEASASSGVAAAVSSERTDGAAVSEQQHEHQHDEGMADSEQQHEHQHVEGDARPGATAERLCLSPVNVEAIMKFCSLAASRELMHGAHSFAELCFAQVDRATKIPGRPGMWTYDAFAPARRPEELGLRAGMEVKYDSEHPKVTAQDAGELNGLSVFSFPKVVRLLVRSETPCRIVDLVNSHFVMALELAASEGIQLPLIDQLVRNREDVIAAVQGCIGLDRDGAKKLLLSVLYGAAVKHEVPFLREVRREVEAFALELARRHPAKIAKLQEKRRGRWRGVGGDFGQNLSLFSLSSPVGRACRKVRNLDGTRGVSGEPFTFFTFFTRGPRTRKNCGI
jgi:hypothetical protein